MGDTDETIVPLIGDVDASTIAEYRRRFDEVLAVEGVRSIVIDMSRLETIDSSGLGLLVHMHSAASDRQVAVTLDRVPPRAVALLQRTGLDRVFVVTESPATD